MITVIGLSVLAQSFPAKQTIWNKSQLIEPIELLKILNNPKAVKPIVYNIGFVNDIPHSINIGAANDKSKLKNLEKSVGKISKSSFIVIYCGCCPFENCPNVRPAYTLLENAGFTHFRILNLPTSLKADWIDKGYPLAKTQTDK